MLLMCDERVHLQALLWRVARAQIAASLGPAAHARDTPHQRMWHAKTKLCKPYSSAMM